MKSAFNEIQKVEAKRTRREETNQQVQLEALEQKIMNGNPYSAAQALRIIDEMIFAERENLKAIQERIKQKHQQKLQGGDEDLQALLD